jgi:hypothetical protein
MNPARIPSLAALYRLPICTYYLILQLFGQVCAQLPRTIWSQFPVEQSQFGHTIPTEYGKSAPSSGPFVIINWQH